MSEREDRATPRRSPCGPAAAPETPPRRRYGSGGGCERRGLASIPEGTTFRPVPGWPYDVSPCGEYVRSYHGSGWSAGVPADPPKPFRRLAVGGPHPETGERLMTLCRDGATLRIDVRRLADLVYRSPSAAAAIEALRPQTPRRGPAPVRGDDPRRREHARPAAVVRLMWDQLYVVGGELLRARRDPAYPDRDRADDLVGTLREFRAAADDLLAALDGDGGGRTR